VRGTEGFEAGSVVGAGCEGAVGWEGGEPE
jgi:hypothetical protein